MQRIREESWGQIHYDPDSDEFIAERSDDSMPMSIDRPLSVGCLGTGRCNLRCAYCYGNEEALPMEEISAAEWKAVFVHLRSWGVMRVDLSGGEPTVRKDIRDICQAAVDA